jgi:hypothetical protein
MMNVAAQPRVTRMRLPVKPRFAPCACAAATKPHRFLDKAKAQIAALGKDER